jgi:hypothetical protein
MATLSTADTAKTDNPLKLLALNAATTATPRSGLLLMPGFIPARAGKSETPLEKLARYRRIDHAHPNPSQAQI